MSNPEYSGLLKTIPICLHFLIYPKPDNDASRYTLIKFLKKDRRINADSINNLKKLQTLINQLTKYINEMDYKKSMYDDLLNALNSPNINLIIQKNYVVFQVI